MQPLEYRSVRYWSKEINGTRTGGRKRKFFNSRRRGGRGHRPAAPAESCQSLPKRCPWGRQWSVPYTCKCLHRIRRRFEHFWSISLSSPRRFSSFRPIQKLACVHAPQTEAANERSWQRAAPYSTGPRQQSRVQSPTRSPRKLIWRQALRAGAYTI